MKKVLAAVGCGLVAVCLIFAGCTHIDHTDEIEQFEAQYGGGSSGGSDVLSNVYDYQMETDEEGGTSYYQDEDGNYKSTRPDYDSIFDYDSGYENIAPEPSGQPATLTYSVPEGFTFDVDGWSSGSIRNVDSTTGEGESIVFGIDNNVKTGDLITVPTLAYSDRRFGDNNYSLDAWTIVYEDGTCTEFAAPGATISVEKSGTLCPCFGSAAAASGWSTDYSFTADFDTTTDSDGNVSTTYTNKTHCGSDSVAYTYMFDYTDYRVEAVMDTASNYWFRSLSSAYSVEESTDYKAEIVLTNYNATAISLNVGMIKSGGDYTADNWSWFSFTDESTGTTVDYKAVTIQAGASATVEINFNSGSDSANDKIMVGFFTTGTSWLDANDNLELGMKVRFGTPASYEAGTPVTVTMKYPKTVTATGYTTPTYFETGDTLTMADLPSAAQLVDSNEETGILGARTFVGWYVREMNSDGSYSLTIIPSSGYPITSTSITVAPYYYSYDENEHIFNSNPGSGCNLTLNDVKYNTIPNGNDSLGSGTYQSILSEQSNTAIVEPGEDGGYAMLGTSMFSVSGYSLSSGNYFRPQSGISSSIQLREDIVEIYRFQNYSSDTVKFKATLVNSGQNAETNYIYIYLAPGESAEYIYSVEYSQGDATNSNAMILLTAMGSFSLNIGVSISVMQASDLGDGYMDSLYSTLSAVGSGYTIGAGILNNTTATSSDFVACITNSTVGAGLTEPTATASLVVSYDLADAYVSLSKND